MRIGHIRNIPLIGGIGLIGLIGLISLIGIIVLKQRPKGDICSTQMQEFDSKLLSLEPTFEKVSEKNVSPVNGKYISYDLASSSNQTFKLKDSDGGEHQFKITVVKPDNIELQKNTYKDALENIFTINTDNIPEISYQVELPQSLILDDSLGGFVTVRTQSTGEELLMFKYPQGIDAKGERIDFSIKLEGDIISIVPHRDWQLGCGTSPITLYSQVTAVAWDEALVKVGDDCDGTNCLKDGDIMQVRPAGWNWGNDERKVYAIVKVPKSTIADRVEYSSRTIEPPDTDGFEEEVTKEEAFEALPEVVKPKIFEIPDLARYAIDYTALATSDQLKNIRDHKKISPILDATTKPEVIKKKSDPRLSIIFGGNHLAFNDAEKLKNQKTLWEKIMPQAQAAGVVVKTIGTAAGRDYSTIASWESAEQGDLVTLTEIHVGEMYKDFKFDITTTQTIDGSTTNSSYYMHLTVAEGERHRGIAETGVVVDCQNSAVSGIDIRDPNTRVEWVEVKRCTGASTIGAIALNDGAGSSLIQNVIIHNFADASFDVSGIIFISTTGYTGVNIRNCLVYDGDHSGILGDNSNTTGITATIENCTIYGALARGIYEFDGGTTDTTFTVQNVVAMNTTTSDIFVGIGTVQYSLCEDSAADCAAGDVSVTCTNCQTGMTNANQFVSTTSGSENFHLKSGSNAIDNANPTAPTTFATDIDLESRPQMAAWDIGSDEYSTDDAVGFWKMDEGADNTCTGGTNDACDSSGNVNDGASSGGTAWKPEDMCVNGKCLFFDGTDDVVTVTNSISLDFDTGLNTGVTFAGWVRVNSDGEGNVGEIYDKGATTYLRITNEGADGLADLEASLDLATTDATATVTDGIILNRWHHVAVAYTDDGDDEITVYIDGKNRAVSTNGVGGPAAADANNLLIGGSSLANYHGFVDMFKVYPYERTSDQIKTDQPYLPSPRGSSVAFDPPYLSDGLVGYWKLDEASTGAGAVSRSDSSGNATTLTDNNTTASGVGKFEEGADFESLNSEYLTATDNAYLSVTGSLTVSAWVKPESLAASTLYDVVGKFDDANESYQLTLVGEGTTGEVRLYVDSASNYATTDAMDLATATWYHIAAVYNAPTQTVNLYVNGLLKASTVTGTIPSSIGDDAGVFHVGSEDSTAGGDAPGNFFDGVIDDARVYKRALTGSEVVTLYDWGPGPVGWWKLDENTYATAFDSSTSGNNMNESGTPTSGNGRYGKALDLENLPTDLSQNVDLADASQVGLDITGPVTVEAWVKIEDTDGAVQAIAGKDGGAGQRGYSLRWGGTNTISFLVSNDGTATTTLVGNTALSTNTWYHLTVVYDGANLNAYVNGSPDVAPSAYSSGIFDNTAPVAIGGRGASGITDGADVLVDDVRIYNYARTPKQIIEDMNAGHPAPGSPVGSAAGYWKLDEGFGTTAQDNNSLNNDLTLSTASWTNSGKFGKAWNGTGGAIRLSRTDDPDFDFAAANDFSISLWFKSDSTTLPTANNQWAVHKRTSNAAAAIGYATYFNSSGQYCFGIDDDAVTNFPEDSACTSTNVFDTNWHQLVATKTGTSRLDVYLDGRPNGTPDTSISATGTLENAGDLFLGDQDTDDNATANEEELHGDLDEAKIYRLALTSSEVKVEYNWASNAVLGTTGTTSGGVGDWSSERSYCPPGDTTASCSPVGEWLLDESTGTAANDTSTNGNNGTLDTAAFWETGRIGPAVRFNNVASDSDISINDAAILDFGAAADFTLEAWVNRSSATEQDAIIYKRGSATCDASNIGYNLYIGTSGDIDFEACDGVDEYHIDTATGAITVGQWYHVVAVWDDDSTTNTAIYLNGIKQTTTPTGTLSLVGDLSNTFDLCIGGQGSGSVCAGTPMNGIIDSVRVYNYALTPAQIVWNYSRGAPIGWWKFDECTGYKAFDASLTGSGASDGKVATISALTTGSNTKVLNCNSGDTADMWHNGTTGKLNSSLDFDGTNDYVEVMTEPASLDFADGQNFTIEAWINRDTFTTDDTMVAKKTTQGNTTAGYIVWIDDSTDDIRLVVSDGDSTNHHTVDSTTTFTATGWNHIVVVYDDSGASNSKIYVNGRDDAATNTTTGTFSLIGDLSNTSKLRVGAESDVSPTVAENSFDGKLDNVKIYNYVPTLQQVRTWYNEGSAVRFGPNTGSP